MTVVYAAPNFERTGVVAGFVLSRDGYFELLGMRIPAISRGVLFAQGAMYRPAVAPTLPEADANQQSWLYYNSSTGFYWADTMTPATAGDAFLGWIVCDADTVIGFSRQEIEVPAPEGNVTVIGLGAVLPQGGLPGEPVFSIAAWPGGLEFFAPSFTDLSAARTIRAAKFTVWAWDETAPVTAQLSGGIDADDTSLGTDDLSGFTEGDYCVLDSEIVRVFDFVGSTAMIDRAQLESSAATHSSGATLIRLAPHVFSFSFPEGFFLLTGAGGPGDWTSWQVFRAMRVCAALCSVVNAVGESPVAIAHYTDTADQGLRTLSGGQVDVQVQGVLGVVSEAAPPTYLAQTSSVLDIQAFVKQAPTGAAITVDVTLGPLGVGTLTIAAGETESDVIDGRGFPPILTTHPITIDITQVGSTFPGEELVVRIRL